MGIEDTGSRDAVAALSGGRIRAARVERGWSQEDLAKATGWLSASRIGNYEQGTRRVGFEEAEALVTAMGQVVPYWMGIVSDQESAVLAALRKQN